MTETDAFVPTLEVIPRGDDLVIAHQSLGDMVARQNGGIAPRNNRHDRPTNGHQMLRSSRPSGPPGGRENGFPYGALAGVIAENASALRVYVVASHH